MEIGYNFISLVSLGHFNPGIASPEFLKETCGLELGELTGQSNPLVPVIKDLQYGNLRLIVEMEKMQIIEQGITEITKTNVLNIFNAYYSKLSYTPLKAVGLNINGELITKGEDERSSISEKLSNPQICMDFFEVEEIGVEQKYLKTQDNSIWVKSNYHIQNIHDLNRQITAEQKKDSFVLNYNFEAGNLKEDESKLKVLINGYEDFYDEFSRFLNCLED